MVSNQLNIRCLGVVIKTSGLGVMIIFFSNILHTEHEVRMCLTV